MDRRHPGKSPELGDDLVDLHGPHDHQSLLSPDRQLDLLDAFANADELREKFGKFSSNYARSKRNTQRLRRRRPRVNRNSICRDIR